MKLITAAQERILKSNWERTQADEEYDPKPVLKLFAPWGAATWLITEMDPKDGRTLVGLCDLGHGTPELGYVDLVELQQIRGRMGLKIERDRWFKPSMTISAYTDAARKLGRIEA